MGSIFLPGSRWFAAGSIMLLVIGLAHTFAHFGPLWPRKDDPALTGVYQAMRDYRFELGPGPKPSVMDFFRGLSLTMSLLLFALGSQNLLVLAAGGGPALLQKLALTSAAVLLAMVILFLVYRLAPVMLGTALLLFVLSLIRDRTPGG